MYFKKIPFCDIFKKKLNNTMENLLKIIYNDINTFNSRKKSKSAYYSFNNSAEKYRNLLNYKIKWIF